MSVEPYTAREGKGIVSGSFTEPNPYFGTDDPINVQIVADGTLVVECSIADTTQTRPELRLREHVHGASDRAVPQAPTELERDHLNPEGTG